MNIRVKGMVRWLVNEAWPICPHCLNTEPASLQLPKLEDGETDEIACSHCGRSYVIRAHVKPLYDCHPGGSTR